MKNSDFITLENEFINPEILEKIEESKPVYPSSKTISMIQDKFIQKNNFKKAGLPLPVYDEINSKEEAIEFGNKNGFPYVLKTRTLGYDGYGNATVKNEQDIVEALERFNGRALLAEKFVNFKCELAVIAVRSLNGKKRLPLCGNYSEESYLP